MNFIYNVTIRDSKKQEIKFTPNDNNDDPITGVEFVYNSDDKSLDHDKNARVEVTIKGKFNSNTDTLKAITALANWAIQRTDVYREVEITASTTEGDGTEAENFVRSYKFDRMFCIDYKEKINDQGIFVFELFMAQQAGYKKCEIAHEVK